MFVSGQKFSPFMTMCVDLFKIINFLSYYELRNLCFLNRYYLFKKAKIWKHTSSWDFQRYWDVAKQNLSNGNDEYNWMKEISTTYYLYHLEVVKLLLGIEVVTPELKLPAGDEWMSDIPATYYPYHLDVAKFVLGSQKADRGNAHLIIDLYGNCRKHVHGDVQNRKSSFSIEESCCSILKCYPWFAAYFFKFLAVHYYNSPRKLTKPGDLYEYFLNPPILLERWSN